MSPLQYQGYDCEQIAAEVQRISVRVNQLGGRLDEAANNDKGIMAVGLILFWPVLFALGGTKQQEAEYSRLKGEYDALEQQATLKKCTRAAPSAVMTAAPVAVPVTATAPVAAQTPVAPAPTTAVESIAPALVPVSAPATVAPAAAVAKSVPIPAVTPSNAPTLSNSKYLFTAERFAKGTGCESAAATMNIRTATYETFTVTCSNGEAISVRCENDCRVLK